LLLLKLAVSAALLVYLFTSRLAWRDIERSLAAPVWPLLAAALAVYAVSAAGGALQWAWIVRAAGIGAPMRELLRLYGVGLFFNNFLPANLGGDAVKIVDLGRQEGRPLTVFCATLLDRLIGLSSLTLLALCAFSLAALRLQALPPVYPLLVAMIVWLALLALLLSRRVSSLLPRLLAALGWRRPAERLQRTVEEFRLYRARVHWLGAIFAFSIAVQSLRVATHLLVAGGLALAIDGAQALQLFVLVPMLGVLVALPISVNGIGLRESAAALLFVTAGIAAHEAVAMQLVAFLVQVTFSLLGGVLFLLGRRRLRGEGRRPSGVV
jgi:uncharacterized protein (TIRG00374 family)